MATAYSIEDDPWSASTTSRLAAASSSSQRPLTWAHVGNESSQGGSRSNHRAHNMSNGASSRPSRTFSEGSTDDKPVLQLPSLYDEVYQLCRSSSDNVDEGSEISLAQLHRIVRAAPGLTASQVERIITLACPPAGHGASSHCSKEELFLALVLIAQIQQQKEPDVREAQAEMASNEPESVSVPDLDVSKIQRSALSRQDVATRTAKTSDNTLSSLGTDPWKPAGSSEPAPRVIEGLPTNTTSSLLQGSSFREDWDAGAEASGSKRASKVPVRPNAPPRSSVYLDPGPTSVHLLPDLGGFLFFRHILYLVKTPLSKGVKRRYSDFADLHEYLLARYPFRLIPPLPPKRLALPHLNRTQSTAPGQQDAFLEQRRLALARYARGIISHPVLSKDETVNAFFGNGASRVAQAGSNNNEAANASTWKGVGSKEDIVEEGLDESHKLSEADIMHVPVDMDEKLAKTREMAGAVLERWNGVVVVFERHVRRTEATAADSTRLSLALSSLLEAEAQTYQGCDDDSVSGVSTGSRVAGIPKGSDGFARSTSLLVSNSQDYADLSTARFHGLQRTLDALKSGRDVWISVKELFRRHDKQGKDPIAELEGRIHTLRQKWKQASQEKKPGYQEVCANLQQDIELDQKLIERYRRRNQRVRVAIWHEIARLQELKNHILIDWRTFARSEAVNLAATKQAAEELAVALEELS